MQQGITVLYLYNCFQFSEFIGFILTDPGLAMNYTKFWLKIGPYSVKIWYYTGFILKDQSFSSFG